MTVTAVAGRPGTPLRRRVRVSGLVQGVGFRPYVYRLATELHLAGHVGNDTAGVFIEVEGDRLAVDAFEQRLAAERPPLARIDAVGLPRAICDFLADLTDREAIEEHRRLYEIGHPT